MSVLYILPHAGGAAHSYRALQDALKGQIDVRCLELPGRGRRAAEPGLTQWNAAVQEVLRLIDPPHGQPWALFGHSMGALLGTEVLHRRALSGQSMPVFFAPSGSPAPAARRQTRISHLPQMEFWAEIERYGGVPAEILAVPDFRDYFESILRLDFSMIEDKPPVAYRLDLQVEVFFGTEDMTKVEATSWRDVSTGQTRLHAFPGDHFYLFSQAAGVARALLGAFGRAL